MKQPNYITFCSSIISEILYNIFYKQTNFSVDGSVNINIFGRCANRLNGDDDKLWVDGGRVKDLEDIVLETDKKKKKRVKKKEVNKNEKK